MKFSFERAVLLPVSVEVLGPGSGRFSGRGFILWPEAADLTSYRMYVCVSNI